MTVKECKQLLSKQYSGDIFCLMENPNYPLDETCAQWDLGPDPEGIFDTCEVEDRYTYVGEDAIFIYAKFNSEIWRKLND